MKRGIRVCATTDKTRTTENSLREKEREREREREREEREEKRFFITYTVYMIVKIFYTFLSAGSRLPFRGSGLDGEDVGDAGDALPTQGAEPGVGDPASKSI